MTINQRLEEYASLKKLSQTALSKSINISQAAVGGWFTKGERISVEMITRILLLYKDLNARWLITGEGVMLEGPIPEVGVNEPSARHGKDALQMVREISKENGVLEERVRTLEAELALIRKEYSDRGPGQQKARAG